MRYRVSDTAEYGRLHTRPAYRESTNARRDERICRDSVGNSLKKWIDENQTRPSQISLQCAKARKNPNRKVGAELSRDDDLPEKEKGTGVP